jgi:hypothetical protein
LWRWLRKSRADSHGTNTRSLPEDVSGQESKFRLESLEPRLLLSGDPVLAELARWVEDDGGANDTEALAVIIQEIDLATESEIATTSSNNSPIENSEANDIKVDWPEGWQTSADETTETAAVVVVQTNSLVGETGTDPGERAEIANPAAPLVPESVSLKNISVPGVSKLALEAADSIAGPGKASDAPGQFERQDINLDELYNRMLGLAESASMPASLLITQGWSAGEGGHHGVWKQQQNAERQTGEARGQIDLLMVVTDLVGEALQISIGDDADGSHTLRHVVGVVAGSQLLRDSGSVLPTGTDSSGPDLAAAPAADAPGLENTISSSQLDAVLQKAIDIWSATILADGQAGQLEDLRIEIADLADGVLAELRGTIIYIDVTAAGLGWYINPDLFLGDADGQGEAAATAGLSLNAAQAEAQAEAEAEAE